MPVFATVDNEWCIERVPHAARQAAST